MQNLFHDLDIKNNKYLIKLNSHIGFLDVGFLDIYEITRGEWAIRKMNLQFGYRNSGTTGSYQSSGELHQSIKHFPEPYRPQPHRGKRLYKRYNVILFIQHIQKTIHKDIVL